MTRSLVAAALLLVGCASPRGQGAEFDAARRAFAELEAAESAMNPRLDSAEGDPTRFQTALQESVARIDETLDRFLVAFDATNWADWPRGEDDRLVQRALPTAGQRALDRGDAVGAVRAYELTAERLFSANTTVSADLPYAMYVAGDTDG